MSEPALAVASESSPFKFLDYFEEKDRDLFAGRDREVSEVVAGILRARTFVLYSRSGLGKTSLLLAGVFPEIREYGLTPIYLRSLDQPLDDLRRTLIASFTTLDVSPESSITDILRAASAERGIVLVIDQAEEIFIRFEESSRVRRAFVEAIAGIATDPTMEVRIVFSLREDYLAELDDFRTWLPEFFVHGYRLHPLTAFGARQVLSRSLQHAGLAYEQRLLTGLVDALQEYQYDPAVLQMFCSELYRETVLRGEKTRVLRAEDVERLGDFGGISHRYLENVVGHLRPKQVLLAMVVLDSLVTRVHTKNAVTIENLLDGYFIARREEVIEILMLLVTHRIVRLVEQGAVTWFELIHDRLVEPVETWLKRDPRFFALRSADNLVAYAAANQAFRSQPELLLTSGQIQQVVGGFRDQLRFTEAQLDLLFRSAVFRCTDVSYWAERFGTERSLEVVLSMLRDFDPWVRRGAAEAAGQLPVSDTRLEDRCLTMALEDPDEAVRRAAGRSLALLAQTSQPAVLAQRLRDRLTRGAALETLADLVQTGAPLTGIGRFWQWRARRIVRSRLRRLGG